MATTPIYEKIQQRAKAAGLSIQELQRRAGCSKQTLPKWKTKTPLSIEILINIENALAEAEAEQKQDSDDDKS